MGNLVKKQDNIFSSLWQMKNIIKFELKGYISRMRNYNIIYQYMFLVINDNNHSGDDYHLDETFGQWDMKENISIMPVSILFMCQAYINIVL